MKFSEKLKELRKAAGLSVSELSFATRLTPAAIYALERGSAMPSANTLMRIAQGLGVGLDAFDDCIFRDKSSQAQQPDLRRKPASRASAR
jgi:transcriptional regulator with XRE-family HTH domain